jgi:hypothetical protein
VAFVVQRYGRDPGPPGLPSLDALTLPDHQPAGPSKVQLTVLGPGGKPGTEFHRGDNVTFVLENMGAVKVHYQLMAANVEGKRKIVGSNTLAVGEKMTFPLAIKGNFGKEQLTVFASPDELPDAVPLQVKGEEDARRLLHPPLDPGRVVKKTVTFETLPDK